MKTYSASEKNSLTCHVEPFEWYAYRAQRIAEPFVAFGVFDDDNRDVLLFYKTTEAIVEKPANESGTPAIQAGVAENA